MPIHQIEIDLVPYLCKVEDEKITILKGKDSILGNLENNPEITGNRFSDDHHIALMPGCPSVTVDGENVIFESVYNPIFLDNVLDWIRDNFDGINEIGWEVLYNEKGLEKALKMIRGFGT